MATDTELTAAWRDLPERDTLEASICDMLAQAKRLGADAAEASLSASRALSVSVRDGRREALDFEGDRTASITVYRGGASGSASTTDLSGPGLTWALDKANTIARFTEVDPYAGLADADLMAGQWPDLNLYNPWSITAAEAEALAGEIEQATLAHDSRISQTEGATVATQDAITAYANSHGFIGIERASRHALSCTAIAHDAADRMQRDIAFSQARRATDLATAAAVGGLAGQRVVDRLGPRSVKTGPASVVFAPRVARSLWGHLLGAIAGGALYRDASFLKDAIDTPIADPGLTISQHPHRAYGLASAGFDGDGVATRDRTLVANGILRGYVLSAYSARRLGMAPTGNAGGVFNIDVAPGAASFDELIADMGTGLVVTELMGQGVNLVNGDYSRGAAGWWVENGRLAYPVENATIAGNLADMYRGITLANDVDTTSALATPSVRIERMTVAG